MKVFKIYLNGDGMSGIGIVASEDPLSAQKLFEDYFFSHNEEYNWVKISYNQDTELYENIWSILSLSIQVEEMPQLSFIGDSPKVLSEDHQFE